MKHINCFGLCDALEISKVEFEDLIAGLTITLSKDELKDLRIVKTCRKIMRQIGLGYGLKTESAYLAATRLIANIEPLLIRLLGRSDLKICGYNKMITCTDLTNLLNMASGLPYFNRATPPMDEAEATVCIASDYTSLMLEMEYADKLNTIISNLNNPVHRTSICSKIAGINDNDLNVLKIWAESSLKKVPLNLPKDTEAFRRLITYISHIRFGYNPALADTDPEEYIKQKPIRRLIAIICKNRNKIVHEGMVILENEKATEVLESAFIFLAAAAGVKAERRPMEKFRDRIIYGLLNPIRAIVLLWHHYLRFGLYILAGLSIIWCLAPIPMAQRVYFIDLGEGGQLEQVYEAIAKKDTAKTLEIYREAKIIKETLESIK